MLVVGDAALTAERLIELLDAADIRPSGNTDEDLRERLKEEARSFMRVPPFAPTAIGTIDLVPGLKTLDTALPKDRVLVADLGRFASKCWRSMRVTSARDLIYTAHFGSIGFGLPEAVGAAFGTNRTTVLVTGDGGFMLGGFAEFATAVRENLDLVVIVCNDGSYGAEYVQFTRRGMDPALSMTRPPDFRAVAAAIGSQAVAVECVADLKKATDAIARRSGPVLIELRLDAAAIDM